ncbi:PQQ-binding-like beta-propeller repeat protein [Streptomyces sp. TS71-3]|uniref:outer membrane protein assembly factor BamB family protein n=1 Tax=Streptomyces sp. TS71-3 TaxID=2733862 RepID=UPI001B040173|nr:PQQ-binding-like beta-propeller repeat protein [Streptomyces sp. TS71-3]GHJ36966.1 hypothetical protein Sm713_25750 [Streptomyces sp. TS71-3]
MLAGAGIGGYFLLDRSGIIHSADPDTPKKPADALPIRWQTQLPKPDTVGSSLGGLPALWTTKTDNPVYADEKGGVRAFDHATGRKLWTLQTPKGASEVCAAAPEPSPDGVGAVAFDAGGDDCAFLDVFDTDTGRTLWTKNLASGYKSTAPRIAVGRHAVITDAGGGVRMYSVSGGHVVFIPYARGHDCGDDADWTGDHLATSSSCSDAKPKNELDIRDLEFGDTYKFPGDARDVQLVAGDRPLTVVFQGKDDDSPESVQTYDDGKPQKAFQLPAKVQFDRNGVYVDSDQSVMVSSYDDNTGTGAVDLRTGKLLWSKKNTVTVGTGDGGAIAVQGSGDMSKPSKLVSIDLHSGAVKTMGTLYVAGNPSATDLQGAGFTWSGNVLYVVTDDGRTGKDTLTLRAFESES